jgi:ABC-type transport system involved in multi-copper enzyme maturation permease subunit
MRDTRSTAAPPPGAAILVLARSTFGEALHQRSLYVLLGLALVLIGASHGFSRLTVGDEEKIIKDVALSATSLCGVLIAVFVGVPLVFREFERKTIETVLSGPVRRWEFVAGKFAGLLAVLALPVGICGLSLAVILGLRGQSIGPLVPALAMTLVELAIVAAFALLFTGLTNRTLAALWTFVVYVAGHLAWSLKLIESGFDGGFGAAASRWAYRLFPNLDYVAVRAEAVHAQALPAGFLPTATVYGVAYAMVVLAIAALAYQRMDIK